MPYICASKLRINAITGSSGWLVMEKCIVCSRGRVPSRSSRWWWCSRALAVNNATVSWPDVNQINLCQVVGCASPPRANPPHDLRPYVNPDGTCPSLSEKCCALLTKGNGMQNICTYVLFRWSTVGSLGKSYKKGVRYELLIIGGGVFCETDKTIGPKILRILWYTGLVHDNVIQD